MIDSLNLHAGTEKQLTGLREMTKMKEPEDEDSMQGSNNFNDYAQVPLDSTQAAKLREEFGQPSVEKATV